MNTDTETAEAVTETTTEATQAELPVVALFDPARLPERDEGFTYHPDLALMVVDGELNDERIDPAKVAAAGFSLQIVEKSNGLDVSDWTPEGDGQLVAIYDNEHGTFAAFVTPKEAAPAEPESEPAEFPSGYTDAEPDIVLEGTRSIARETMLGDLMNSMLDEVKAIPDVWQKLPQYKQDQVLARIEGRSRTILGRVVEIIAADARPSIPANVESVTVKDGIKAVLAVSRSSPQRHDLVDAQGSAVMIVIADAEPYTGGDKPKSQKDQRALALNDTSKPVADSCPATTVEG